MSAMEILYMPVPRAERQRQADEHRAACESAAGGPGCAPWCVSHDDPVCYAAEDGPVVLTYCPADGPLIDVRGALEALTPDQAEKLAQQLLDRVAKARAIEAVAAR